MLKFTTKNEDVCQKSPSIG